jgi:hypothetical protein
MVGISETTRRIGHEAPPDKVVCRHVSSGLSIFYPNGGVQTSFIACDDSLSFWKNIATYRLLWRLSVLSFSVTTFTDSNVSSLRKCLSLSAPRWAFRTSTPQFCLLVAKPNTQNCRRFLSRWYSQLTGLFRGKQHPYLVEHGPQELGDGFRSDMSKVVLPKPFAMLQRLPPSPPV